MVKAALVSRGVDQLELLWHCRFSNGDAPRLPGKLRRPTEVLYSLGYGNTCLPGGKCHLACCTPAESRLILGIHLPSR